MEEDKDTTAGRIEEYKKKREHILEMGGSRAIEERHG